MDDGMACGKYGRSNLDYMFWKWQPHDCELPRFDAISLLEKLRNKRVVFVGDSLNRNQWVSLVCLIESSIHDESLKWLLELVAKLVILDTSEGSQQNGDGSKEGSQQNDDGSKEQFQAKHCCVE
nr:protein trichome birefringence-like 34 [Ipomoea batatas]